MIDREGRGAPEAICVLGMMRSGTSLVAGVLDLLGVNFGPPERWVAANRANPTGFWEHQGVIAINDRVLASLGGSWSSPPDPPRGWEHDPALRGLREEAAGLVSTELASRTPWGFKDPRTCLTLPFWASLVPAMASVVCVRHPADMAESLGRMPWATRRLSSPIQQALDLWTRYTAGALSAIPGDCLVVFYDDWFVDWRKESGRLAEFAGLAEAADSPAVEASIAEFIRPGLRHHQAAAATREGIPPAAQRLYAELRQRRG